jgi:hypothetical protein
MWAIDSLSFSFGISSVGSRIERINKTKSSTTAPRSALKFVEAKSKLSTTLAVPTPTPGEESIETFEVVSNACTNTPKTSFQLGDQVCAKVTNAPLRSPTALRTFNWVGTKGFVRQTADVVADPDSNIFTLPASNTSIIDGETIDNRGIWAASLNSNADNIARAIAYFNVSDPANTAADLIVYNFSTSDDVILSGASTGFFLWLSNAGPDTAANVHVLMAVPTNMTYVSASTASAFSCSEDGGVVDCTNASWPSGAVATITLNFTVSGPDGVISSVADISSDTNDPRPASNSSTASVEVRSPGAPPATCALSCPPNIVTTATSPSGAAVTYSDVEVSGDCGTISFSPASGSTFAIGTTPVNVNSSVGGGSCSFTVTVIDPNVSPPPTISCPAAVTAAAPSGQSEATVATGTPTATGTGVTVSGIRNDNRDVTDPYPVGTTTITWRAIDSDQRIASCTQQVTVTSADFPTITCPSNKTFDAGGDCQKTLTAGDIGTPTVGGSSPTVTSDRSDDLALTDPFPAGQTTITWTATNAFGSASCTQVITITASGDTTPPTLNVPADVDVTVNSCSTLLDDELGVAAASDNCSSVNITRTGVPTVACPTPGDPGRMCETFIFPVGTTDVTYTATDASGNSVSGVQHVTVRDFTPPTFTFVPPAVTVNTGPGATSCGTLVSDATLGTATVSDDCDTGVIRTGVPAGNIFPVGTTVITYKAKADQSVTATQNVTVIDNTVPVVTAPGAVTLYTGAGATSCSVTVADLNATLGVGTATDNCPGVGAVTRSGVPAGNVFPVGTTTVTYSATDAHGNSASANQVVTVVDNTLPMIGCPANITLEATCPTGAVGTYTPPVGTDNCASTTARTAGPASGSVFPIGTTTVTHTVTDASGNTASCSFTVTVLTPQAVIQNLIAQVNASSLTGTQKNGLLSKLNAALDAINDGKTNVACNKLSDFINSVQNLQGHGNLTVGDGDAWILSANHVRNTIGCTNNPCS